MVPRPPPAGGSRCPAPRHRRTRPPRRAAAPADGGPHPREAQPAHLPPALRQRVRVRGAQHDRDVVLPRRGSAGAEPAQRGRRRGGGGGAGPGRWRPDLPRRGADQRAAPAPARWPPRRWRRAPVRRDRAGRHHGGRRDRAPRLPLGADHQVGRPALPRRAALRPRPAVARRAVPPVRLQQRLPRHHRDQPGRHPGPAGLQPRVHQREHHVPARLRPGAADPHGLGRPRDVGRRAHAPAPRGHLEVRAPGPAQPPHHAGHPVRPGRSRRRLRAPARRPRTRPGARSAAP